MIEDTLNLHYILNFARYFAKFKMYCKSQVSSIIFLCAKTPDYFLCSENLDLRSKLVIEPRIESDHNPLSFLIKKSFTRPLDPYPLPPKTKVRLSSCQIPRLFSSFLNNHDSSNCTLDSFITFLQDYRLSPIKRSTKMNDNQRSLKIIKNHSNTLRNAFMKQKTTDNWEDYILARNNKWLSSSRENLLKEDELSKINFKIHFKTNSTIAVPYGSFSIIFLLKLSLSL